MGSVAGSIEVHGELWTAASWLFRWVVTRIADEASVSEDVRVTLQEIVDENLGWLSIDDLRPHQRVVVARWLKDCLVTDADARWPDGSEFDKAAALRHLGELADSIGPLAN
jgi:hypothetical protein